jgi:hypothetical protein
MFNLVVLMKNKCYNGVSRVLESFTRGRGNEYCLLYLKSRGTFIDRPGSPNYDSVTLQLGLSYIASEATCRKCRFVEHGAGGLLSS